VNGELGEDSSAVWARILESFFKARENRAQDEASVMERRFAVIVVSLRVEQVV
jgi:hypothetical protein